MIVQRILSLELEDRNIDFDYYNYVGADVKVIADPEQIRRGLSIILSIIL